ncbi:MAG TPA: preprotein translocase subunit YajC [Terriglobia bacterium]|nr:preprotein translocase subunit YajC [Terriglobia bacterium]
MLDFILVRPILFAAEPSGTQGLTSFILLLGPLVLIWYLLIIRPQSRQRRKTQDMLQNLKTGDRVVTSGGMLGTIVSFGNNSVQLQVANQVKVEVLRSAITGMQKEESASPAKQPEEAAREATTSGAKGRK